MQIWWRHLHDDLHGTEDMTACDVVDTGDLVTQSDEGDGMRNETDDDTRPTPHKSVASKLQHTLQHKEHRGQTNNRTTYHILQHTPQHNGKK